MKPHAIALATTTPVSRNKATTSSARPSSGRPANPPRKEPRGAGGNGFLFFLCVLLALGIFLVSAIVYAVL